MPPSMIRGEFVECIQTCEYYGTKIYIKVKESEAFFF